MDIEDAARHAAASRPGAAQGLCLSDACLLVQSLVLSPVKIVPKESRDDMKMQVEDVLSTPTVIVLTDRNAIAGESLSGRSGGGGHGTKHWSRERVWQIVDVRDVRTRNDEAVAVIAALLVQAGDDQNTRVLVDYQVGSEGSRGIATEWA